MKPWHEGDDNGGATAQGVTKDKITVVAVLPNEAERSGLSPASGTAPVNRADNAPGTFEDAVHDYLLPLMKYYETWGRDIEVKFVTSSGDDETAQRADAVTVKAEKPFAVINFVALGLDVLDAELAKAKVLVWGAATTTEKALAQAPYRWGLSDAQAAAINAGEVIGKQLVGKKAQFVGSDDLKAQTRKFGVLYIPTLIDIDQFESNFKKYHGTLVSKNTYTSNGTTFGDDTLAQEQVAPIVTRMKSAGVTTVILFSDVAMNRAMTKEATKQEWSPEWFLTGALFQDLALFARTYDQAQFAHAFGLSNLTPAEPADPTPAPPAKSVTVLTNPLNWYWGEGVGTQVQSTIPLRLGWLVNGIQAAGPKLTAKTFQQGLFSLPATGGAASNYPTSMMTGYGRTAGLPYDEYLQLTLDFAPVWWDADTVGPTNSNGSLIPGESKGVVQYVGQGKRYKSGAWPKQQFKWFDPSGSVVKFDTRQTPAPVYAGDCAGCPATGGPGQTGSPSPSGFVAKANGGGDAALS